MKITSILGSPKKKGNTAKVLSFLEEELINKGHNVERVNIVESDVKGCLGCDVCQKKTGEPGCVQKDDTLSIFENMMSTDVIIYASPIYAWAFPSQMKALIDRHYCLIKGFGGPQSVSLIEGKPMALLATCAGPLDNNAETIQNIFDGLCDYGNSKLVGKYVVPFCTTPDAIDDNALEPAKELVKDITDIK